MADAFRYFVWLLSRLAVPLRYKVRVHGWDSIRDLKSPVLLLPNHPALIDPVIILSMFYGAFRPRSVLFVGNLSSAVGTFLIKLVRAVPVPDLQRPSKEAQRQTEQAIAEVIAGLRRGENFLLWPSGRLQRQAVERLGAARALAEILREVPEANIVLCEHAVFGAACSALPERARCCLWDEVC